MYNAVDEKGNVIKSGIDHLKNAKPMPQLNQNSYSTIGVGGLPMDKTRAFNMHLGQLTLYFDQVLKDAEKYQDPAAAKVAGINDEQYAQIKMLADLLTFNGIGSDPNGNKVSVNGSTNYIDYTVANNYDGTADEDANGAATGDVKKRSNFTLSDLFNKDVTYESGSKTNMTHFVDALFNVLSQVIVIDDNISSTKAFEYAKNQTNKLLEGQVDGGQCKNNNTWVKNDDKYSLSLSNVAASFMTYFAQALGGFGEAGYGVKNSVSGSNYVTDDNQFMYMINNVYTKDAYDTNTLFNADFYNAMLNNLCRNGWTTSTQDLHDPEYLQHALKNGQLFLASLNDEGYFYQGSYTKNGQVMEVADEDAIARATAEYTIMKNKLNYKEEALELDMKNLDMEISALTAEYDSIKGIIGKNTEKAFSLFQ